MTGDTKNNDADDNVDEKTEAVKKPAASRKKIKAKSNEPADKAKVKKNIVEKLQGMGVMSGGKSDSTESNNSEHAGILKLSAAVAVSTLIVGSFIWVLNKEAVNQRHAANADSRITPHSYPDAWQPSSYNPANNPGNNNAAYNYEQQRLQKQRAQQIAQQQKWLQQQQAQEQQSSPYQNWEQQQPNQEQYIARQQKWAQQQQQAREQQRAQQLKWAQQQKQIREQQRAQQQTWAQQQQQPPYYGYPQYGNNGASSQPFYNYQPQYQQPGQYYRR